MNTINYNIDYFIKKFEAIPEQNWCIKAVRKDHQCCVMGHCLQKGEFTSEELLSLGKVFGSLSLAMNINNGDSSNYKQSTPKQRILAALYDLKAKETSIVEEKKEVVKTVYKVVKINFDILEPTLN